MKKSARTTKAAHHTRTGVLGERDLQSVVGGAEGTLVVDFQPEQVRWAKGDQK